MKKKTYRIRSEDGHRKPLMPRPTVMRPKKGKGSYNRKKLKKEEF